MRLPFRRGKPAPGARGSFVSRDTIDVPGQESFVDRLRSLGMPVADATADDYAAGRYGTVPMNVGSESRDLVAGDDCPGGTVTQAPSVSEHMQRVGGFTWKGRR